MREEIDYAINDQNMPVIVIYPEYETKESLLTNGDLKKSVKNLWDNVPRFRDSVRVVPTIHVPMKKDLIKAALEDPDFKSSTKTDPKICWYSVK